MLSKLMKHELLATSRVVLLFYAAVAALAVLSNLSIRFMDFSDSNLLAAFGALVSLAYGFSIVAVLVATALLMMYRFDRNLLKDEGYLMHTLPASVHAQIWSKLLIALLWDAATVLLIVLLLSLGGLFQSGTRLGELFEAFPAWGDIRRWLLAEGINPGQLGLLLTELTALGLVSCLVALLHFYAAMSLGHMFSRNKGFLSVVFFLVISFAFRLLSAVAGYVLDVTGLADTASSEFLWGGAMLDFSTATGTMDFTLRVMCVLLVFQIIKGALLYAVTALSLERGLNLA